MWALCGQMITLLIVADFWYDTRNTKAYLFNPSNLTVAPRIIEDRNSQDIYSDPGNFEMKRMNLEDMLLL